MARKLTMLFILFSMGLSACQALNLSSKTPYVPTVIKNWLPTSTPTRTPDQSSLPSPTSTEPSPLTVAPSQTPLPSITPSPTAALINIENAVDLKPYLRYPASFIRGEIRSAAWAPGDQVIILETTKGIHLLDPTTLAETAFHSDLSTIAVSENGIMITASEKALGWINLNTGQYQEFTVPDLVVDWRSHPVTINPRGEILVTSDPEQEDTLLFYSFPKIELEQKITITHEIGIRRIQQILYSPNGESLFLEVRRKDNRLSLIHLNLNQPANLIDFSVETEFRALTANSQGDYLAYQSDKPTVIKTSAGTLWKTLSASFNSTLNNQQVSYVSTDIGFRDNTSLGIAYRSLSNKPESIVIIWNINTGQILDSYDRIPGRVASLDFSLDGDFFLVTTEEGLIRLYNRQGEELVVSNHYDIQRSFDISLDGQLVAVPSQQGVDLYDLAQDKILKTIGEFPATNHIAVKFANQDIMAISVTPYVGKPYTELWDIQTGTLIRKYDISDCTFSTNGTLLACGPNNVQIINANRGQIIRSYGSAGQMFHYQLDPKGKYLAICSYESNPETHEVLYSKNIWLLDVYGDTSIRDLVKDGAACSKMAFTNTGFFLIASSGGIWSVPEGELVSSFNGWPEADIILSPKDNFFLFKDLIISLPSGEEIGQIDLPSDVLAIRFSNDGSNLVVLTKDELSYWRVNP